MEYAVATTIAQTQEAPHSATGDCIICFAKDWSEEPTSNNHVMAELARSGRVLWLNSVCTRRPSLTSGRDLKKVFRKLGSFFRGATRVQDNLWVYTPLVLPLPHSRWATAINRHLLALTLRVLRWRLGFKKDFQLWSFLPNVTEYLNALGGDVVVYYCTDEWSKFNYVDGPRIAEAERRLCRRADVVFATARSLVENKRQWNPETHLALHGVDHVLFSRALDPELAVPAEIASLPRPLIGFYGTLQDWVDFKLIARLAERHPEWSIVLLGKPMVDLSAMDKYPNVHILGPKPHVDLPAYCKEFSVGIIPYLVNERIMHVNPIKLREYLCAGLPVVSIAIPEVQSYPGQCAVANDHDEFERAIVAALKNDSPERRRERSEAMRCETWQHRVVAIRAQVQRVKDAKRSRDNRPV